MMRLFQSLVVSAALLAFAGCQKAPQNVDLKDFRCYPSMNPQHHYYGCYLKEGSRFLGVTLGMQREDAFAHICKELSTASWNTRDGISKKTTPVVRGLRCTDWPSFEKADMWNSASDGRPCAGQRLMVISVVDNKVRYLNVICPPKR